MWSYNPITESDILMHSNGHKYLKREWKNGQWQYTYKESAKYKDHKAPLRGAIEDADGDVAEATKKAERYARKDIKTDPYVSSWNASRFKNEKARDNLYEKAFYEYINTSEDAKEIVSKFNKARAKGVNKGVNKGGKEYQAYLEDLEKAFKKSDIYKKEYIDKMPSKSIAEKAATKAKDKVDFERVGYRTGKAIRGISINVGRK